jgi:MFS family permease
VAEQATDDLAGTRPGAVEGAALHGAVAHVAGEHFEHNSGRPMSWVGTTIVIIGFIIGGISMIPGPHWVIFWIGTAVAIVGCLTLLFTKTFSEDWY